MWCELVPPQPATFADDDGGARLVSLDDDGATAWTLEITATLSGVPVLLGRVLVLPGRASRAVAIVHAPDATGYEITGAVPPVRNGSPRRARVGLSRACCAPSSPLVAVAGGSVLLGDVGAAYDLAVSATSGTVAGYPCALGTGQQKSWLRASAPSSNASGVYLVLADATTPPGSGAPTLAPVPIAPGQSIVLAEPRLFAAGLSWVCSSSPAVVTPVTGLLVSALVERRG